VPLIGGAILGNLPYLGLPAIDSMIETWYLRGYFVFALVAYTRWALLTINKICAFLDINCLTIKKRDVDEKEVRGFQKSANGALRSTRKKH
jgi:ethanolaminephosphotransferase